MERSDEAFKGNFALFIAAAAVTFGFISLLQFVSAPWFYFVLAAMHGGILLFIVSKRRFKKTGFNVSRFYNAQYLMLIPYLLIMFYVFATRAGIVPMLDEAKAVITLSYTALCAAMTVWNCLCMKKALKQQCVLIIENKAKIKQAATSL